MSIEIREYNGFANKVIDEKETLDLTEAVNTPICEPVMLGSLMAEIEGIHAGPTRNFTRYTEKSLKDSVASWTKPYRRPMIKHHNEENGVTVGRICAVEYVPRNTRSGTPALVYTVNIPDKDAAEQAQDGRLDTVSIGVIGLDVRCSICGHNIAKQGPCEEHDKGNLYGGQLCYWDVHKFEAKELSYVIVPSDPYTKTLRTYRADNKTAAVQLAANLEGDTDMTLKEELEQLKASQIELTEKATADAVVLTESQTKVTELETLVSTQDVQVTEAAAEITVLKASLAEVTENLAKSVVELTEAKTLLDAATETCVTEKALREAAETATAEAKQKSRISLTETVNKLRAAQGETELGEVELAERSNESLSDNVKDLVESLKKVQLPVLVGNPTLGESEQIQGRNVKERNLPSNINLEEGLTSLFADIIKARS